MNINNSNYEAFFLDYHEGNLSAEKVAALLLFVEQHPELKREFEEFENIVLDTDSTPSFFADKSFLKKEISPVNKDDYFIGYIENTLNETEKKIVADYLKQQPAAVSELEAYKNTIVKANNAITFENKNRLKKVIIDSAQPVGQLILTEEEYLLIASLENVLSIEEAKAAKELLKIVGTKNLQEFYQQTKLKTDKSIVFENKKELKRENRKVIPFYYYAAAASVAILLGLFFIFKNTTTNNQAETVTKPTQYNTTNSIKNESVTLTAITGNQENKFSSKEKVLKREISPSIITKPETNQSVMNYEDADTTTMQNQESHLPSLANKETVSQSPNEGLIKKEEPITIIANIPSLKTPDMERKQFIPLNELATEKIKEKLLDEETLFAQKQNGQLKKINGWDIAQMAIKGVSKISGRKLELKPKYNEDGSVSSYAFSAGEFQISKKL